MTLQVLISCMYQEDTSLIERSNIQTDAVVINQCDNNKKEYISFKNQEGVDCQVLFISTTERGLSRSRNMAIRNATADICLLCDDDEVFEDDYEKNITEVFENNDNLDIITFLVNCPNKKSTYKSKKVGYIGAMQTASWQIAFKRESIVDNNIQFDVCMGSGTGNGAGEENMFLFDCLKSKLKLWYTPILIATVAQTSSNWFKGFTNTYFSDRGWVNRRLFGVFLALIYALYYSVTKYTLYKHENNFGNALYYQVLGVFQKR